jgi:hypothetical protein
MRNKRHVTRVLKLTFSPACSSIRTGIFGCLVVVITAITALPQVQTNPVQVADNTKSGEGIQRGENEFGLWGGISFDAPTLIGKTPNVRFGNFGLRYGRVLAATKTVAFEWTIDVVPLAILSNDRFTLVPTGFVTQKERTSVYAAGVSPIGLKFNFRRRHRVQPFAGATGGFLYFGEDVPVSGAKRFNFTFDLGGGIQFINSSRRAFIIGYKYQHISNGDRSPINPGVDLQLIYAGFSMFR